MTRRSHKEHAVLVGNIQGRYAAKGFQEGITFTEFKNQQPFKSWNDKRLTNFLKKLKKDGILHQPNNRGSYYLMEECKASSFGNILNRAINQYPYDKTHILEIDDYGIISIFGLDYKKLKRKQKEELETISDKIYDAFLQLQIFKKDIIGEEIKKKTESFIEKHPDIDEKYIQEITSNSSGDRSAVFFINLMRSSFFNNEITKKKLKPFFKKDKLKPVELNTILNLYLDIINIYIKYAPFSVGITLFAPHSDFIYGLNLINPLNPIDYELALSSKQLEFGNKKEYQSFLKSNEEIQNILLNLNRIFPDNKLVSIFESNLRIIENKKKKK